MRIDLLRLLVNSMINDKQELEIRNKIQTIRHQLDILTNTIRKFKTGEAKWNKPWLRLSIDASCSTIREKSFQIIKYIQQLLDSDTQQKDLLKYLDSIHEH